MNYLSMAEELGLRGNLQGEQLRAGCPIHGGRDLNFSLNVKNGMWTCWSTCGAGHFTGLVRQVLGVGYVGALDWIAEHDYETPTLAAPAPIVHETEWWRQWYEEATDGLMPTWWFDRGYTWADRAYWGVRWNADRQQLIIPYWWRAELRGTVARNFARGPKYQNSPRLPRREMLFGFNQARLGSGAIVLVEGPLDAMWLHKHGYPGAALLGLQLSEAQILLMRDCSEIVLAMDNDEAGQEAQREMFVKLAATRLISQIRRVDYPVGRKDVSECTADELARMVAERRIAV